MDICKNFDYMTQAFLAQVAILAQTMTSEFLNWTGRYDLLLQHNASIFGKHAAG